MNLPANSHKSIVKTSLITGGGQVIVMMFNMVRAKALAVLLGPGGTGIIGLYSSVTDLVNTVSSMALTSSAVKDIAAANADEDKTNIRKTLFVYRWLIRITSVLSAGIMFLFAEQISKQTFGSTENTSGVQWVSLVVLFAGFSNGQMALLQGLRKIKALALARIIGSFLGTIFTVTLIYFFRKDGIVPFLIAGAGTTVLLSWFFAQREEISSLRVSFFEFRRKSVALFSMGFAFLISGLTTTFTAYYSRSLIAESFSLHDLGLYTASWTLSAMYVNFILSAMGVDFYPRLSGVIQDHEQANKLVNDQTETGIAMAMAGVVGIVAFSAFFLRVFYSVQFYEAWKLLQWMTLGMAIKVVCWPLGFIIVSKGRSKLFIALELAWGLIYILLFLFLIRFLGLEGAGVAFFTTYLIQGFLVWVIAKNLTRFVWSENVKHLVIWLMSSLALVFGVSRAFSSGWQYLLNAGILVIVMRFAYIKISNLLGETPIVLAKKKFNFGST
jgi:antigen flippase